MKERQTPASGNGTRPETSASGDVDTPKLDGSGAVAGNSQTEEGDSVSAASGPPPATIVTGAGRNSSTSAAPPAANGPPSRRYRGRRRLRERKQVRARFDELCSKLERKEIDPKVAAIQVQCLNGVLSCLNAEKDEDFEKRLKAVEEKTSADKPRKRGADA